MIPLRKKAGFISPTATFPSVGKPFYLSKDKKLWHRAIIRFFSCQNVTQSETAGLSLPREFFPLRVNSLPNDKILDSFELNADADDK